ncbi:MAG TPA: NAD(P)-binding domain-containing protein, partial [bacterium]|nr:NAD(P)-binding domain-containing protein [bacterium]
MAGLEKTTEALGDKCLGILGAGHMGRAVARGLAGAGFPLSRLRVCHRGSSATLSAIQADGLEQCLVRPDQLGLECGIIVAAIRPQDRGSIAALSPGSLFISFMAGTPLASLPLRPGIERVRVMPSAPSTIALRRGIAAVFPQDHVIAGEICRALGLTTIPVSSEDSLHAFTALGPCLPVA